MLSPRIVRPLLLAAAWSAASLSARAQAFNLDVGDNLILWPVPSASYGAAAAQTGVWNNIKTPYSHTLLALDGSTSAVTCSSTGSSSFNYPFSNLTGDDEAFIADCQSLSPFSGTVQWNFQNLADGSYAIYTYAYAPEHSGAQTLVDVVGSGDPAQVVGGLWAGSPHVFGVTYALHHVTVSGGTLQILVAGSGGTSGSINGFQFVPEGAPTSFCAGDGSGAVACPCGNNGSPGRGCENSAGTGGAKLTVAGSTSPDTLVLTSSGELPTVLSIFLQGDQALATPAVFGDGLRCVGGSLKRLYVENAVGGTVSAPGPGDPSVSQQSANLGDPIAPGSTRWYQVYYRDPVLGFCANPPGNAWNVSSGVVVLW